MQLRFYNQCTGHEKGSTMERIIRISPSFLICSLHQFDQQYQKLDAELLHHNEMQGMWLSQLFLNQLQMEPNLFANDLVLVAKELHEKKNILLFLWNESNILLFLCNDIISTGYLFKISMQTWISHGKIEQAFNIFTKLFLHNKVKGM